MKNKESIFFAISGHSIAKKNFCIKNQFPFDSDSHTFGKQPSAKPNANNLVTILLSDSFPDPRVSLLLRPVRPEVHVHAEGDELDEEEHVGDGDAREEAVDGGAVHLLRGGAHI